MKINKTLTALIAGASIGMSGQAFSATTTAGITITNQTILSYDVSSTPQEDVPVSTSFQVDNKVDMELQDNTVSPSIVPGATATYTYTLSNSGNDSQVFALSLGNSADAVSDDGDIDFSSITVSYNGAPDAGDSITYGTFSNAIYLTIPKDETATFTASFTFPKYFTDGTTLIEDGDDFNFLASVTAVADDAGTALADHTSENKNDTSGGTPNLTARTLIVKAENASVLATSDTDGANDGSDTVISDSSVVTARFTPSSSDTVTSGPSLTVLVLDDPICNVFDGAPADTDSYYASYAVNTVTTCASATAPSGYKPKAIPGALVEYTITAYNAGSVDADNVDFVQDIADSATYTTFLQSGTIGNIATSQGTSSVSTDILTVNAGTVVQATTVTITFTAIVE
ncbi:MAG: hypothetical protein V7785_15285 [Bermanella sp.]